MIKNITITITSIISILLLVTINSVSKTVYNSENDVVNVYSNFNSSFEEIYNIHYDLFPKVKSILKKHNLNIEEYNYIDNIYYSGNQGVLYQIPNNLLNSSQIYYGLYEIGISSTNEPTKVYATFGINIDENTNLDTFRFEDTIFAEIDNIMLNKSINYNDLNKKIIESYKNSTPLNIENMYDNLHTQLTRDGSLLCYTVTIYAN